MPEVHHVYGTVRNPMGDDLGQVTNGYYMLVDGVLTMTDRAGVPIRGMNNGEKFQHKLAAGDDTAAVARRLTMRIYRMLRGGDAAVSFNRKIVYPTAGIA
jgi:hypothetical protein